MSKFLLASASILVFALGAAAVQANPTIRGMMSGFQNNMGQGMMNGGGRGSGMMGFGPMGSGMMMNPDMMLIMMDVSGDGTLSLEEFQAMPTRMFNYLDTNKDGKVDAAEMTAFSADRDTTDQ
jgi:hypothetical protein